MEPKVKIIKHIAYLINESTRIANDQYIDNDVVENYFIEVRTIIEFILETTIVDTNTAECLKDVLLEKPKPSFWIRLFFGRSDRTRNIFLRNLIEKDLRERIAENKTALIHLYRAVAREEILSGKLPML